MQPQHQSQFNESLEHGDMQRVISPSIHVDEFKSKMGEDSDICVFSFKVMGKQPAEDLSNFIEKGYTWVLDAETSSGEMSDGDYIVFVEVKRDRNVPAEIMELVSDMLNLTKQDISEWEFSYHKDKNYLPLTIENLHEVVPISPQEYQERFEDRGIKEMKIAAGVPVTSNYRKSPELDQLQLWAGIK